MTNMDPQFNFPVVFLTLSAKNLMKSLDESSSYYYDSLSTLKELQVVRLEAYQ